MDEMTLLLVLLVVSYFGNALIVPGQAAAISLPSGSQFILLGFVLGPHVLGVVPSDAAASFMPLAMAAISWLSLVLGTSYGYAGDRRLLAPAFVRGFSVALLSAALIAAAVFAAAYWVAGASVRDAQLMALGIGLAGCETTRQSARWVLDRGIAPTRLLTLLEELAVTDEVVPLLGLSCFFALAPPPVTLVSISHGGWFLLTLLLGAVLGLTSALLVSGFSAAEAAWGVLLGAALLGTGIAWRLSLSPLTTLFVMGVCLSLGSRHAAELRPLLARTGPGVLLPALLLTGALLRLPYDEGHLYVSFAAVVVRIAARVLLGRGLAQATRAEPQQRWPFGFAMCCTGSVSVLVGLSFALYFPGPVGDVVLSTAVINGVLGDVLGIIGMRQTFLARSGGEAREPLAASAS